MAKLELVLVELAGSSSVPVGLLEGAALLLSSSWLGLSKVALAGLIVPHLDWMLVRQLSWARESPTFSSMQF